MPAALALCLLALWAGQAAAVPSHHHHGHAHPTDDADDAVAASEDLAAEDADSAADGAEADGEEAPARAARQPARTAAEDTDVDDEEAYLPPPPPTPPPPSPSPPPVECNDPKEGDVMLTSYPKGTILVYVASEWGTVCKHYTQDDLSTADLVCQQLGYDKAAAQGVTQDDVSAYPISVLGRQCSATPPRKLETVATILDCHAHACKHIHCGCEAVDALAVECEGDPGLQAAAQRCGSAGPKVAGKPVAEELRGEMPAAPAARTLSGEVIVPAGAIVAVAAAALALALRGGRDGSRLGASPGAGRALV